MSGITQEIPNYGTGGISEQPDQLKVPGQVKEAVNVIPDVIHGLYKRPGSERVGTAKLASVQSNGSWFHYHRDQEEGNYIGQIDSNGTVRVWDCETAALRTTIYSKSWVASTEYEVGDRVKNGSNVYVCDTDGTSASSGGPTGTGSNITDGSTRWDFVETYSARETRIKNYLKASSASATEDLQTLTINDTTFVTNRTKNVGTTGTTGTASDTHRAYVELLRSENGRQYGLNLFTEETNQSTLTVATRIRITGDNLYEGGGGAACTGIGTQVFNVSADGHVEHVIAESTVNISTDTITITNHGLSTGNVVTYRSAGDTAGDSSETSGFQRMTPLEDAFQYYVIKVDNNNIQLAETAADAAAGTDINLTNDGNDQQFITTMPYPDVEVKNAAGNRVTTGKKNLVFRLNTNGQQGAINASQPGTGSEMAGQDYQCSYRREITLLHGGEGWVTGDTVRVLMDVAGGIEAEGGSSGTSRRFRSPAWYTIEVEEHSSVTVKARVGSTTGAGLIRPSPTPFDSDTAVTPDIILGDIEDALPSDITGTIIGNGIYLTSSNSFNVEIVDLDLMRVMTSTIDDIGKLPIQCKHGYITNIRNTQQSDEDDYWLKFVGENNSDGAGTWTECAKPGIVKGWDPDTMPHILQRQSNGDFLVDEFEWADREVGDDNTNPIPSFSGKPINKVLSYANRLAFLSGENVTLSRPATFGKPNFWADTALTVSIIDPIDISSSSKYPADLFDGIEITTGLLIFSTNQQFLLSSDAEQLSAETAKLRAVSAFNYNKVVPPIYMGTSVAWIDNTNKYSRFVETADVAREGEPVVQETSKLVPTLLPKEIDLIADSRDNSLILFGKTGSDTVIGFRYFNTARERQQASWFKWKHNEKLLYHFIVNDEYIFLDEDHFLQKINLIQGADDPSVTQTDVGETTNFLLHLDNWTTIFGGVYNSTTKKTTFTHGTNSCVFNWQSDIPDPNGDLVLVDVNSSTARVGRYVKAESINSGTSFVVEGDWATNVTSSNPLHIGYLYEYSVKFPRIYRVSLDGQRVRSDTRASLVVHRIKLNFGKIGLYATTLDRVGKLQYTDVYESSDLDEYNVDDAPYLSRKIKTIPVYEKNENVAITLKSSHPAPATLYSMAWEGAYTPKLYNRG